MLILYSIVILQLNSLLSKNSIRSRTAIFFQQVINHIHLWLRKSKNNCDIVSKQLLNKEHMLRHIIKVLITDG